MKPSGIKELWLEMLSTSDFASVGRELFSCCTGLAVPQEIELISRAAAAETLKGLFIFYMREKRKHI